MTFITLATIFVAIAFSDFDKAKKYVADKIVIIVSSVMAIYDNEVAGNRYFRTTPAAIEIAITGSNLRIT